MHVLSACLPRTHALFLVPFGAHLSGCPQERACRGLHGAAVRDVRHRRCPRARHTGGKRDCGRPRRTDRVCWKLLPFSHVLIITSASLCPQQGREGAPRGTRHRTHVQRREGRSTGAHGPVWCVLLFSPPFPFSVVFHVKHSGSGAGDGARGARAVWRGRHPRVRRVGCHCRCEKTPTGVSRCVA